MCFQGFLGFYTEGGHDLITLDRGDIFHHSISSPKTATPKPSILCRRLRFQGHKIKHSIQLINGHFFH